jgi:indole-3-glycerol phosphate synthase/phosphoribosylanthranilate isomerase
MNIIEEITRRRRHRIGLMGHSMGATLPARRSAPLVPFGRTGGGDTFLVCEVKRASPSRGSFAPQADAVEQARRFVERGIRTLSVLTEEEYFSGSLEDLYRIKKTFPNLCLMRKDFIIDEEDIEVSFRVGADAVLLIASMHPVGTLRKLYRGAKELGLEVLLEVHDGEDLEKARNIKPAVTGFNSRNLRTFHIDHLAPLKLRGQVDWKTETVYESGITSPEHAALVLSAGFSGMLIGEAAMRNAGLIDRITEMGRRKWHDFWYRLFGGKGNGSPLVKVCGLTREEDARFAAELGADLLGFIFAPSPRRAHASLLAKLADLRVPKVGVVVQGMEQGLDPSVRGLLEDGLLDALQFHGDEHPDTCFAMAFPYYKALRVKSEADVERISSYRCPRVLIDTYVQDKPGGTGRRIAQGLVDAVRARHPLWLAGGIGPENVGDILRSCEPELIDVSSRLEVGPGRKDWERMRDFFDTLNRGTER